MAIPGMDRLGESVQIVDVRQEANEIWVKVRFAPQSSRAALPDSLSDAVVIRRDGLPILDSLVVYFVDELYQAVEPESASR